MAAISATTGVFGPGQSQASVNVKVQLNLQLNIFFTFEPSDEPKFSGEGSPEPLVEHFSPHEGKGEGSPKGS